MKVIGLTGGIGAGKSTVSKYLRERGYLVIDADQISHQITEKGSPVLREIAVLFGKDILECDGSLNRRKLADIVFADYEEKTKLEQITTKEIVNIIKKTVENLREEKKYDIIFIDAPLLFEAGVDKLTDMVWIVNADEEIRIRRVMERDEISREAVCRRISNQMDNDEKLRRADEIIDNGKGKETLYNQVENLLKRYAEG